MESGFNALPLFHVLSAKQCLLVTIQGDRISPTEHVQRTQRLQTPRHALQLLQATLTIVFH